jgi:hypothetical protein
MRAALADERGILDRLPSRADFDRSRIAMTVMAVYAVGIACSMVFLIWRGLSGKDDFSIVSRDFSDLIKTGIVPIVTLVLGYYFGRSGRA